MRAGLNVATDFVGLPYRERMKMAFEYWKLECGMVSSHYIAKMYSVNSNEFSLFLQKYISQVTEIEIYDCAPEVEIVNTKEELDYKYPRVLSAALPFTLDFFAEIVNNNNIRNGYAI